jgi:hypothetical protein
MAIEDGHDPSQTTLFDEEKFKTYSEVDSETSTQSPYSWPSLVRHKLRISIAVLLLLAGPLLYFTITKWTAPYDQCGTTPAEARARSCTFETTGFAWLPRACLDPTMEDLFLAHVKTHNLTYYRDVECTQVVSLEEVRRGDMGYYVRETYHKTHCAFLLRKLHHMWIKGKPVDGQILSQGHTKHCVAEMLGGDMMHAGAKGQFSYLKFPYCGKEGGYNLEWPAQGTWI